MISQFDNFCYFCGKVIYEALQVLQEFTLKNRTELENWVAQAI